MSPADGIRGHLRKAKVKRFSFPNQIFDRTCNIVDGHLRIQPVTIQKIDTVRLKPLEHAVHSLANMFRLAVSAGSLSILEIKAKLAGNDNFVSHRRKRLTDELFIRERTIHLGRVEKGHTPFHSAPYYRDQFRIASGTIIRTRLHAHAAQPDR